MINFNLCFFVCLLSILCASHASDEVNDNRNQCTSSFEGIVCYPIDCCGSFVQCINGALYPPQVRSLVFSSRRAWRLGQIVKTMELSSLPSVRLSTAPPSFLTGEAVLVVAAAAAAAVEAAVVVLEVILEMLVKTPQLVNST